MNKKIACAVMLFALALLPITHVFSQTENKPILGASGHIYDTDSFWFVPDKQAAEETGMPEGKPALIRNRWIANLRDLGNKDGFTQRLKKDFETNLHSGKDWQVALWNCVNWDKDEDWIWPKAHENHCGPEATPGNSYPENKYVCMSCQATSYSITPVEYELSNDIGYQKLLMGFGTLQIQDAPDSYKAAEEEAQKNKRNFWGL